MALNYLTLDTTLDSSYRVNLLDASGGSFTITLWEIDGNGDEVYLSRVDSDVLTSVIIQDSNNNTIYTMSTISDTILHLISYGGSWYQF